MINTSWACCFSRGSISSWQACPLHSQHLLHGQSPKAPSEPVHLLRSLPTGHSGSTTVMSWWTWHQAASLPGVVCSMQSGVTHSERGTG